MQRSTAQNRSLHKWLTLLADELNASGQSLGDGKLVKLPVRYTGANLKEHVLKPYLNALWPEKESTTELSTAEIQMLYQDLDHIIAERSGCHVEWPSEESLSEEQR
jgi:allophanate hydrolase subunit 1